MIRLSNESLRNQFKFSHLVRSFILYHLKGFVIYGRYLPDLTSNIDLFQQSLLKYTKNVKYLNYQLFKQLKSNQ